MIRQRNAYDDPHGRHEPIFLVNLPLSVHAAALLFQTSQVTCGGMPSQMRLSPSLSHVVDAGGPLVYVWHGAGSHGDGRRYVPSPSFENMCMHHMPCEVFFFLCSTESQRSFRLTGSSPHFHATSRYVARF